MARQSPRPNRNTSWMETNYLPQPLVDEGLLPAVVQHMQQHPGCWACHAPATHTVTALCRGLNQHGGNVTFYSLCEACAASPEVRQRIEADLDNDTMIAMGRYN